MKHHPILHLLLLGLIYASFGWWTANTYTGRNLKTFLQTWKADGWVHGIMCSISVFIWGIVGIFALALSLEAIGL